MVYITWYLKHMYPEVITLVLGEGVRMNEMYNHTGSFRESLYSVRAAKTAG